jgi:hypothetical protein
MLGRFSYLQCKKYHTVELSTSCIIHDKITICWESRDVNGARNVPFQLYVGIRRLLETEINHINNDRHSRTVLYTAKKFNKKAKERRKGRKWTNASIDVEYESRPVPQAKTQVVRHYRRKKSKRKIKQKRNNRV